MRIAHKGRLEGAGWDFGDAVAADGRYGSVVDTGTSANDSASSTSGARAPIVSEELFDRVQEVRSWRTRVLKPGPPSDEYLLRKLLHCERCGARIHRTRGSRPPVRRLPVRDAPPRGRLRPTDHTREAARGTTPRVDLRLSARRRAASDDPCIDSQCGPQLE
jgi:hypothetical protein